MKFLLLISMIFLQSCTISIILTNTHGVSDKVVDSKPTTETKTDAQASIPLKGL